MKIAMFVNNIPGWEIAGQKDNHKILSFYNSISMAGGTFNIRFVKDPDYFKFNNYESKNNYVIIAKNDDGDIECMLSLMVRPCYVNGKKEHVGHFSDLRAMNNKKRKSFASWSEICNELLINSKNIEEIHDCKYFIGSFASENKYAIKAIRNNSPWEINEIATYKMVRILARKPLKFFGLKASLYPDLKMSFRKANHDDIPELKVFLGRQNQKRAFGFLFNDDQCELERRFDCRDNFSISNFYIARNDSGGIAAVFAFCNPSKGRKVLVDKFPLSLELIGKALNFFGKNITAPGAEFEALYLTHPEFNYEYSTEDRRHIFNMLLDELYKTDVLKNYQILSFCDYENENITEGMEKDYLLQKTKNVLYQMYDMETCGELSIIKENEQEILKLQTQKAA